MMRGRLTYDEAEDLANGVQDELAATAASAPGTSLEALARDAYDAVMRLTGYGDDEEDE